MSSLLDRGREIIYVYPEVKEYSNRGDLVLVPSDNPVKIRCTTSGERSQIADLPGQIDVQILSVTARKIPVGEDGRPATWSRVVYRGQEFDMAEPPHYNVGATRATDHWSFKIRSRSNLSAISSVRVRKETKRDPSQYGPIAAEEFY